MTIYTVHQKGEVEPDNFELVPEGFAFWAFAFTIVWAAIKGLWLVAVMMLAAMLLLVMGVEALGLGETPASLLQLAISVLFGFEAHNLQRWTLARRGYREVATVSGDSREMAELAYVAGRAAAEPASPQTKHPASKLYVPADALGLFGNV